MSCPVFGFFYFLAFLLLSEELRAFPVGASSYVSSPFVEDGALRLCTSVAFGISLLMLLEFPCLIDCIRFLYNLKFSRSETFCDLSALRYTPFRAKSF